MTKWKGSLCLLLALQKEYVEVPDALLAKTSELKTYFAPELRLRERLEAGADDAEEGGFITETGTQGTPRTSRTHRSGPGGFLVLVCPCSP
jgi:hypothetical protein